MKADLFIGPGAARILNPEVIGDCGTIHRENDLYEVSLFQIKLSQEKAGVGPAGIQAAVSEPGMQGGVFRIQEMKGQEIRLQNAGYFSIPDLDHRSIAAHQESLQSRESVLFHVSPSCFCACYLHCHHSGESFCL